MNERYHALPRDLFNALAAGSGGPDAMTALSAAEHSKHHTLLRGVLDAVPSLATGPADFARHGRDVLLDVELQAPLAVDRIIRYPSVAAWALKTLQALNADARTADAYVARLSAVAAAAAVQAGLDVEVPVRPAGGVLSLPSLGAAQVDADTATVRSSGGRAEIRWAHGQAEIAPPEYRDSPGWQGLRRFQAGDLHVVLDDLDPFRMPAVSGLAPRLTTREADGWATVLRQGWQLLAAGHPAVAAEAAAVFSVIVPLSPSVHGHISSSAPDTFGAVAMSEPPDPHTCAVTFAHELQHLKLGAVLDIVTLTLPDDGRRYYAPWRDDPRPIAGLLQGAYAHLGVTEFWRTQRRLVDGRARPRAEGQFALWREGTARVIGTLLTSGGLTITGQDFVRRMAATVDTWQEEPVSPEARTEAQRESRRHLAHWERRNGPLPA
jgi:uncharacterized protein